MSLGNSLKIETSELKLLSISRINDTILPPINIINRHITEIIFNDFGGITDFNNIGIIITIQLEA